MTCYVVDLLFSIFCWDMGHPLQDWVRYLSFSHKSYWYTSNVISYFKDMKKSIMHSSLTTKGNIARRTRYIFSLFLSFRTSSTNSRHTMNCVRCGILQRSITNKSPPDRTATPHVQCAVPPWSAPHGRTCICTCRIISKISIHFSFNVISQNNFC